jgi:hypothetical protein
MSTPNKISVAIPAADMSVMLNAIDTLNSKLTFLLSLSEADRKELPKMGDKTIAFVTKCLDYAKANPKIVPAYLEVDEFEKDIVAVGELLKVLRPIHQLYQRLDDTVMQAGSEAYQAGLLFYTNLKGATKAGVPGAKTIYQDLAERFPGRGKKQIENSNGTAAAHE